MDICTCVCARSCNPHVHACTCTNKIDTCACARACTPHMSSSVSMYNYVLSGAYDFVASHLFCVCASQANIRVERPGRVPDRMAAHQEPCRSKSSKHPLTYSPTHPRIKECVYVDRCACKCVCMYLNLHLCMYR